MLWSTIAGLVFYGFLGSCLLDLDALCVLDLSGLWHVDAQDPVLELGGHLRLVDVVDVEGTAHGAGGTLAADVVPLCNPYYTQ